MFNPIKDRLIIGLFFASLTGAVLVDAKSNAANAESIKTFQHYKSATIYNPLDKIKWTKVKDYGGVKDIGSAHYLDVISHTDPNDPLCPRANGMAFSQPSIRIHETEHMLSFQITNLSERKDINVSGLYYQNGNGVIFAYPKAKVTDFMKLIPQELRDAPSPYQTYIVDQMKYPSLNNIGYLFNEWASYRSNIILNLELEKAGIPEADAEGHAANYSPHFFGYLAIAMHHLRSTDPAALNDEQLKAVFALYAEESWRLMNDALKSPTFGTPDTYNGSRIKTVMAFYRTSPKFAAVKSSLIAIYGEPWVTKLMK